MAFVTRQLLLQALAKHGPLTDDDLATEKFLGLRPDAFHLKYLLHQLVVTGKIRAVEGISPVAYALVEASAQSGTLPPS